MKSKHLIFLIITILFLLCSYSVFVFLSDQKISSLASEDGLYESIGAIFFLVASVFFLISYMKDKKGNDFSVFSLRVQFKKNIFFVLLALMFFLGFGEEISWGQRIFDIQTPEAMKEINVQDEINIHNINIFHGKNEDGERKSFFALLLNIERLFTLFWLSFCVLIPILYKIVPRFSNWLDKIALPIVPIWIGGFFILNYILSRIINTFISTEIHHSLMEIKECNFSFLFAIVSIWFFVNYYHSIFKVFKPKIKPAYT